MEESREACYHLTVTGTVQGVGFRPYIYRLATGLGLRGWVLNASGAVEIEVEGSRENLASFCREIKDHPPPLAKTRAVHVREVAPRGYADFRIRASAGDSTLVSRRVLVPPDVNMCSDCRAEIEDPKDRHYAYPFTNCTNCGPRFTIVRALPYDRANTTMSSFPMCPECAREYHHPADRRFHAQPTACPLCGPQVALATSRLSPWVGESRFSPPITLTTPAAIDGRGESDTPWWVREFRKAIAAGLIVAVKGIGGFHLACDALNEEAVRRLRHRKNRPRKPFAVMARDVDALSLFVALSEAEKEVLTGPASPIVLVRKHGPAAWRVAPSVAPGLSTLGVMIAYSPLHRMLFGDGVELLVMTSGNRSGLPLAASNGEALEQLSGIADLFLLHDREIENRADDSVVSGIVGEVRVIRRSRGYVPQAIRLAGGPEAPAHSASKPATSAVTVIGIGGDLKNTFCLLTGDEAFLSQHIGDMESVESRAFYCDAVHKLCGLLDVKPAAAARDSHPAYFSRRLAGALGFHEEGPGANVIDVQHHHAHMVSCQAENGLFHPTLAAVLDGTGYGADGNLWGFEILAGDAAGFKRFCHQGYVPLPGGEAAIHKPWVVALSYVAQALGPKRAREVGERLFGRFGRQVEAILKLIENPGSETIPMPLSCGAGRLLDAASALAGVCLEATYEGQAAIELGESIDKNGPEDLEPYRWLLERASGGDSGTAVISFAPLIAELVADRLNGVPTAVMAARVHLSIAGALVEALEFASRATGLREVVLSGGVWQNPWLTSLVVESLQRRAFSVYCHRLVPANDGGIALGQAVVARYGYWRWRQDVSGDLRSGSDACRPRAPVALRRGGHFGQ